MQLQAGKCGNWQECGGTAEERMDSLKDMPMVFIHVRVPVMQRRVHGGEHYAGAHMR